MAQLHKKFTDNEVKELIERYLKKELGRRYLQKILDIGKVRFFALIKNYRNAPDLFSIQYARKIKTRKIQPGIEENIIKELKIEKELIDNKEVPLKSYNYTYIKDRLETEYQQKVSLPTIINRAKNNGFYLEKKPKKSTHDRQVLTNYAGELIQHDCSYHLWSPPAKEKWYLITSLDDFSRFILYAALLKKETSWAHILAAQTVILQYGSPLSYYVDNHSIFRFVQERDSLYRKHHLLTDEVDPQWKQVMNDCNVKVTYASSPQAKGKIERPYAWLQDRLVRTCVRENVTDIKIAQHLLLKELHRYNYRQIHSTTQEVPYLRFQNALKNKQSLFRDFKVKLPYLSVKDIFCLRINRTVDAYRKISINNLQIKVNANPRETVNLRISPIDNDILEIRFWCNDKLIDAQRIKHTDLKSVHF
ncbi:MAG: hypothetical protein AB1422_04495 [bacterium]